LPRKNGGKDNYQNLVLVLENVHSLIHAKEKEIIDKYLSVLCLDNKQMQKLNKFREQAGSKPITI
jgi:ssRNA-specific RNase YbeY (16S rRNA maturation enzyme)